MAVLAIFLARPAAHHARATTLLLAFSDPKATPAVVEELLTIDVPASPAGPARTVKARMFSPPGGTPNDRPAIPVIEDVAGDEDHIRVHLPETGDDPEIPVRPRFVDGVHFPSFSDDIPEGRQPYSMTTRS